MDDDGAVVRSELDRAAKVAGGACEDFAVSCSATRFGVETTFDLLPCPAKEGLLLEVLLEEPDGDVAQFAGEVVLKLPFEAVFEMLEVVAKVLNIHVY